MEQSLTLKLRLQSRQVVNKHLLLTCLAVIMGVGTAHTLAFVASLVASRMPALPSLSAYIVADAHVLAAVAFAGFLAQLVDGALGMGYGLTSSTVLVAAGLSPMTASACVHAAQLGTTLASGAAHYRIGTVHIPTAWRVALPGTVGALVGASLLSLMPVHAAKTLASLLLFVVGAYLFARFFHPSEVAPDEALPPRLALLVPVGLVGGFVDVAGGGGWGPVATTSLLAEGRLAPSQVIGTVSLSEFFVTIAAVVGFALVAFNDSTGASGAGGASGTGGEEGDTSAGGGHGQVRLDLTGALLLGGLLAAPIAPRLVTKLHPQLLGVVVGGFICLTNARTLLKAAGADAATCSATLATMSVLWAGASLRVSRASA